MGSPSVIGDQGAKRSVWGKVCKFIFSNPVTSPLVSSQARRRVLVFGFVLVLIAFPLAGWLSGSLWAVALVGLLYAAGSLLMAAATQGMLDRPLRALDERQRHVRRSLFREPYMTGAALGIAGGLVIALALQADDALSMGLLLAVFGFVFGLPAMVLAWNLADDVDDE